MVYEMRMRGVEKWWSVYALAPFVLAWLAAVVFGAISGNGALTLIALVGLAGFGWLFWYCIAIGRVYRVVFADDVPAFAPVVEFVGTKSGYQTSFDSQRLKH